MAAAVDNILTVEMKLWSLLLAWPGFTSVVQLGNITRYDVATDPFPKVNLPSRQSGDLPMVSIVPSGYASDPKAARTFCSFQNLRSQKFTHTIVGPDLRIVQVGQIRAEIEACYFAQGSQLGIPAVVSKWDYSGRYEVAPVKVAGGSNRRSITFDLNVTIKG